MKIIFTLLIIASIFSCADDSPATKVGPFFNFLTLEKIKIDTIEKASETWEYGFRFKSLEVQTIKKLGIKVPSVGPYMVKLYNLKNNTLLIDTTIVSSIKYAESYINVPDISIKEGDVLGLSIVADVFFKVTNVSLEALQFPILKENIEILSFNEESCGSQGCLNFPMNENANTIAPCVNLVFEIP